MTDFIAQPVTAEQVLTEARRYIGAPYDLYGRSVNGIDCVGLVIVVGQALGQLPDDLHIDPYPANGLRKFLPVLWEYMDEVELENVVAGCGYLMSHTRISDRPKHLAISTGDGLIQLHYSASVRKVAECGLDEASRALLLGGWRFRGLAL